VGWIPDAEVILITAIDWGQGLRWMIIHPGKAYLFGTALQWFCGLNEQLTFKNYLFPHLELFIYFMSVF